MAQVHANIKESSTTNEDTVDCSNTEADLVARLPTREGWSSTPLTLYNQCWLRTQSLGRFMAVKDNFKPRADDIILVTHPKSGTTWLKALAFTIFNRSSCSNLDGHPVLTTHPHTLVPFIGDVGGDLDYLETLPSPRLLSTHLPLSLLPPAVCTLGCRVVYLCREPKDAFVSEWHFDNKIGTSGKSIGIDDAFAMFCQGCSAFGPFWEHYLQYWKESSARPREVMFLRYEEMVFDTLEVAKKLASFLGVPFTQDEDDRGVAQQIVSFCSFDSLRNLDVNKAGGVELDGGKLFIHNSSLFRKGKVGDWPNHMSKEMAQEMDRLVEDKFKGSGLVF